jgi:hypothetical protein
MLVGVDLDANALLASLFVGLIGSALLVYAKSQSRWPHGIVGAILIVYPYFVPNLFAVAGIAVVLIAGLWGGTRYLGW